MSTASKLAEPMTRRTMLKQGAAVAGAVALVQGVGLPLHAAPTAPRAGFTSLFDGVSLKGWTPRARDLKKPSLGLWSVQDGTIVGGQSTPGLGAYLVSDESYADFELELDARADWRTDTGIYVRTNAQGNTGFQVALDFRPHGAIGGYFGNNIGSFHACNYCFTGEANPDGSLKRLVAEKPSEPLDATHHVPLDSAPSSAEFLKIFKIHGWNRFRIRSVGAVPHLTTWINGTKVAELDTANMKALDWDPAKIDGLVGRAGHISFEVHNTGSGDWLGNDRWAPGNVCRWRNISIKTL